MTAFLQQIGSWRVTAPSPAGTPREGPAAALSVVIPYYRGQATIAGAVQSVLDQTVAPLEIVICDDGSPDDLDAGLGALRERVRVIRQANGGISAAMNALTAASRGDYVVQLDQDDAFMPRRLEALSEVLAARPELDLIATDAAIELGGEQITTLEQVNPFPPSDQRAALLTTCTFMWPAVRRSLLEERGGYDVSFPVMQDWELFLRLVLGGAPMAFVHSPLYRWRLTPGSRSSSDRVENVEALLRMTEKVCSGSPMEPSERALCESLLASRRHWLARERARHAVQDGGRGARSESLALVMGSGFDRATRVKALVAVLSPTLAGRFLERRREQTDPAVEALAQRGFRWDRSATPGTAGASGEPPAPGNTAEETTIAGWRVTLPPLLGPPAGSRSAATLSVIITYYRGEATIAGAVRSVLDQTVAPLEIVICDDGSPDDLEAGLGALREHVRIVRKDNGGTGSALNAAAQAASGDYLVQLDVDDALEPRRLEAVAAVLRERPDVDIVTGDALVEYGERPVGTIGALNPHPDGDRRATMLERNWIPWPAARRSLVLGAGGWDERFKVFEDWDCWLRLVLGGAVVAYVQEPLYRWRLSPDSRSSASSVKHYEDQVLMTEKALAGTDLTSAERELAQSLLRRRRGALERARARDAVAGRTGDARRRSLALLVGPGHDRATRVKSGLAVLSPRIAVWMLERRENSLDPAATELTRRGFSP